MKQLYLLRHAIAVDHGAPGLHDSERPLTEEGRQRMTAAVDGLKKLDFKVEACFSSPLIRAWQTAELVQKHLPFKAPIEEEKSLIPGGVLSSFLSMLSKRSEKYILAVGHEPTLSTWIEELLLCVRPGSVEMKKGGICHLELSQHPSSAILIAHLPPRILRRLGD